MLRNDAGEPPNVTFEIGDTIGATPPSPGGGLLEDGCAFGGRGPVMRIDVFDVDVEVAGVLQINEAATPLAAAPKRPLRSLLAATLLSVEVERELVGMGADIDRRHFVLALVVDPGVDQIFAKDTALQEEVVVLFQGVKHLSE